MEYNDYSRGVQTPHTVQPSTYFATKLNELTDAEFLKSAIKSLKNIASRGEKETLYFDSDGVVKAYEPAIYKFGYIVNLENLAFFFEKLKAACGSLNFFDDLEELSFILFHAKEQMKRMTVSDDAQKRYLESSLEIIDQISEWITEMIGSSIEGLPKLETDQLVREEVQSILKNIEEDALIGAENKVSLAKGVISALRSGESVKALELQLEKKWESLGLLLGKASGSNSNIFGDMESKENRKDLYQFLLKPSPAPNVKLSIEECEKIYAEIETLEKQIDKLKLGLESTIKKVEDYVKDKSELMGEFFIFEEGSGKDKYKGEDVAKTATPREVSGKDKYKGEDVAKTATPREVSGKDKDKELVADDLEVVEESEFVLAHAERDIGEIIRNDEFKKSCLKAGERRIFRNVCFNLKSISKVKENEKMTFNNDGTITLGRRVISTSPTEIIGKGSLGDPLQSIDNLIYFTHAIQSLPIEDLDYPELSMLKSRIEKSIEPINIILISTYENEKKLKHIGLIKSLNKVIENKLNQVKSEFERRDEEKLDKAIERLSATLSKTGRVKKFDVAYHFTSVNGIFDIEKPERDFDQKDPLLLIIPSIFGSPLNRVEKCCIFSEAAVKISNLNNAITDFKGQAKIKKTEEEKKQKIEEANKKENELAEFIKSLEGLSEEIGYYNDHDTPPEDKRILILKKFAKEKWPTLESNIEKKKAEVRKTFTTIFKFQPDQIETWKDKLSSLAADVGAIDRWSIVDFLWDCGANGMGTAMKHLVVPRVAKLASKYSAGSLSEEDIDQIYALVEDVYNGKISEKEIEGKIKDISKGDTKREDQLKSLYNAYKYFIEDAPKVMGGEKTEEKGEGGKEKEKS